MGTNAFRHVGVWQPVVFGAMAGGLAWGIRGQYGHEAGAMIAGTLVSLTLIFLLCPGVSNLQVVRAAALATIAMGFGGTMTYGQTIGLTQNPEVIGNVAAWRWGMLGLGIKGGIWIALAGLFLGVGLGGKEYRAVEMLKLALLMIAAAVVGWALLNRPHDGANLRLPFFYFSAHWQFDPSLLEKADYHYRPEIWGGLLFALLAAVYYVARIKGDTLAWRLAIWGFIGGALGFPGGQCLQSMNAWHPEVFSESFAASYTQYFNWWNMMETTFGSVMGCFLGLGLWLNRGKIAMTAEAIGKPISYRLEGLLLALHVPALVALVFVGGIIADSIYDVGLVMGTIPLVACIRGRYWPFLQLLPITMIPIAGMTFQHFWKVGGANMENGVAFEFLFMLPVVASTAFALWAARRSAQGDPPTYFIRDALLFTVWGYFWLNHAVFDFPWPWLEWTGRTPNGIIFTVCALGLTAMVSLNRRRWELATR